MDATLCVAIIINVTFNSIQMYQYMYFQIYRVVIFVNIDPSFVRFTQNSNRQTSSLLTSHIIRV